MSGYSHPSNIFSLRRFHGGAPSCLGAGGAQLTVPDARSLDARSRAMAALVPAAVPASRFKNIAVFCGVRSLDAVSQQVALRCLRAADALRAAQANPGARPEYAQAAEALAKEMARVKRHSATHR